MPGTDTTTGYDSCYCFCCHALCCSAGILVCMEMLLFFLLLLLLLYVCGVVHRRLCGWRLLCLHPLHCNVDHVCHVIDVLLLLRFGVCVVDVACATVGCCAAVTTTSSATTISTNGGAWDAGHFMPRGVVAAAVAAATQKQTS